MAPDDVPPDEMHLFGLTHDPLDAALRGESDDPAVAALVQDLRAAYLPDGQRPRSAALAAFAGAADDPAVEAIVSSARPRVEPVAVPAVPLGRRVAVGVAAFAATITGKVVLGGAVAAAALGGLHAGEVVDVPLLPDRPPVQTAPSTVPEMPERPEAVDLPTAPAPVEDRWSAHGERTTELDRSEPARTPVPAPGASDAADPAPPDERPGAADAPAPTSVPAPAPERPPAQAGTDPQPSTPPAGDPGPATGRDTGGGSAPSDTEPPSEPGAQPATTADEQQAPSRP